MSNDPRTGAEADLAWAAEWLTAVAAGSATMSQRKLSSVDKHGGLEVARAVAEKLGVHLLQLEDDKGDRLIAASINPFKVIC